MRLNKYLAHAGVASRRAAEELILGGHVRIDGRITRELGTIVGVGSTVEVDGKRVVPPREFTYVMMHKPVGVVTTMRDPEGRRTVVHLLPKDLPRVVPVGRLDFDSSGLLLLTDDGDLTNRLLHPRYGVDKTYNVVIEGRLSQSDMLALQAGVETGEFRSAPAKVRVTRDGIEITVHEGRNRQVRKMFEALDHQVLSLIRLRFGPLKLGNLRPAEVRRLTSREIAALRQIHTYEGGGVPQNASKNAGHV